MAANPVKDCERVQVLSSAKNTAAYPPALAHAVTEIEDDTNLYASAPWSENGSTRMKENTPSRLPRPARHGTGAPTRWKTAKSGVTRHDTNHLIRQLTGMSRRRTAQPGDMPQPNDPSGDVDPEYYDYVPWYGQKPGEPIFGLNRPLPRIIRHGMRRPETRRDEHEEVEIEPAGSQQEPHWEPDLEKGGLHWNIENGPSLDKTKPIRSILRDPNYFDQKLARHGASGDINLPVLPPAEGPDVEEDVQSSSFGALNVGKPEDPGCKSLSASGSQQPDIKLGPMSAVASVPEVPEPPEGEETRNNSSFPDNVDPAQGRTASSEHRGNEAGAGSPSRDSSQAETVNDRFRYDDGDKELYQDPYSLQVEYDSYRNCVARLRARFPRPLAEFVGTTVAIFLGLCINLAVRVSADQENKFGTWETQCWGWGFAFMCGIYMSAGISGAHLNPVITLVFAIFRGFPWRQVVPYILAQLLGGFVGAWLAFAIYKDALNFVDPTHNNALTGVAFYPGMQSAIKISVATAFFNEFLASMILIMVILALGDDQNAPPGAGLAPFIIATVIAMLMMALGYNTGPAISPSRDLGPRIVALCRNYQTNPFADGFWIWGAWGGTFSGGCAGAILYDIFIFVGGESPVNMPFSGHRANLRQKMRSAKKKLWKSKEATEEAADAFMTAAAKISRDERKEAMKRQRGVRTIYGSYTTR